tara:strand:- start:3501 stop:3947 length:447 start_codon:yes stop_codon:yes gene_type:complete
MQLTNFHLITPIIGTSGQPTAGDFASLAREGYEVVINLAMPDSDDAIANEGQLVSSQGMSYLHMPIPFAAPTPSHLRQFCRLMDALEGRKILVHCQVSARVSAFMYKYLTMTKGVSEAEATTPVLAKWLPQINDVWQGFLDIKADEIT